MKVQRIIIVAALVASSFALVAPPASATPLAMLYGSYTDSVTNVVDSYGTPGANNKPTIVNATGGLTPHSSASPFSVSFSSLNTFTNATTNGILFSVNPASCADPACDRSHLGHPEIQTANINFTLSFYTGPGGSLLGSISDTAFAKFDYYHLTDNLCWQDSLVTGTAGLIGPHQAQGNACGNPGAGTPAGGFGYEQIEVNLSGNLYYVDLYDWNDWNELPHISFQLVCNVNCTPGTRGFPTPEPITLSLFGAGLAGAVAMRRRKKAA